MDGNGRWAKARSLPRFKGHQEGVERLKEIIRFCGNVNIPYLTVYAFSTENWGRPPQEISYLMKLFEKTFDQKEELNKYNIKIEFIGLLEAMPKSVQQKAIELVAATKNNQALHLNIALNYGSRQEIVEACKKTTLDKSKLSIQEFARNLFTADQPDIDLLIRTGGERRLSNFLLWQIAYAELYFTEVFWPDFKQAELVIALKDFNKRVRRFGKI